MVGTALVIGEDHTVKVLEEVKQEEFAKMVEQVGVKDFRCKINEKEVHFQSVSEVVWQKDNIDWNYGY